MIYSDRPWMTMACDLIGHSAHSIFSPYNDRLRRFRRMFHSTLAGADHMATQAVISEHETRRFLTRLLRNPGNVREELRRCVLSSLLFFLGLSLGIWGRLAGAIIVKVCHGYELVSEGPDPMIDLIERVMIDFGDVTTPGHYLVDVMPWCELTPALRCSSLADRYGWCSEVPSGVAARHGVQEDSESNAEDAPRGEERAGRLREGADGASPLFFRELMAC
jgi:hypothetical protein